MVTLHPRTPAGDNINPLIVSFAKGRSPRPPLAIGTDILKKTDFPAIITDRIQLN
jgi:hypothetical protein